MEQTYMGFQGMFWFTGVIEDRNDPMKLGRVRVRVHGIHTEIKIPDDTKGIKTDELPWAYPMMPVNNAAMNGVGDSPTGILEGTHVVGFSRDGETMNDLVIMGTLGGVPQKVADIAKGFNDPNGVYPRSTHIKEADTNRLSRNELKDTDIVKIKTDGIKKSVHIANAESWNEPVTPYAAKYPFNHVHESESGHIHEIDDTAGAERLHTWHTSQTFKEIHPNGTQVEKIVKDNYQIVLGEDSIYVSGNINISTDSNCHIYVKANAEIQVDQDANINVGGNVAQTTGKNFTHTVTGTYTVKSGGNMRFTAPRIDHN